ncbi:MAG TPA: 50S ribosomal protein L11 methyltransferase [Thermoanaerobaculia bacterium]|nr:50S ribosomal protein L11 methyltransferase [Thermoanaerobaculia bacterium]
MRYDRRVYLLPPDLEDLLVAELWSAGTAGVESAPEKDGRVRLTAYFPAGEDPELETPPGVELVADEPVPETDWLAVYRERAKPFPVARTLFVDPREPDEPPAEVPEGRTLLRLPARAAFGTGSHESTGLALELLEAAGVRGRRVLDVGTGTGVLSFAALHFGARLAVAFDVDPAAPFHGRENSRLNDLHPLFFAGRLAALAPRPLFDLALVNIVPEQILPEMGTLDRLLGPAGEAILSGILTERGGQVLARMQGLGFAEIDRRVGGDWIAFRVRRRT